jgi:LysM repeat protein
MMMGRILRRSGLILLAVLVILAVMLPPDAHAAAKIHVVRRGENLTMIARRYGTSVQAIMRLNGLSNPNFVWVGQRLRVSGTGGSSGSGSTSGGTIHVVRRGQNLSSIARRYGTSVAAIVAANGLRNPNFIYAGQRLRIPKSGSGRGGSGGGSIGKPPAGSGTKWIDVDLSSQTTRATPHRWEGSVCTRNTAAPRCQDRATICPVSPTQCTSTGATPSMAPTGTTTSGAR